jgi:hypothetical protein
MTATSALARNDEKMRGACRGKDGPSVCARHSVASVTSRDELALVVVAAWLFAIDEWEDRTYLSHTI